MKEIEPALALLEFGSIAVGIHSADAMVKKSPIARIVTGTVQPGKFLVLISGGVAEVQESLETGRETGGANILNEVFLPAVHPDVVQAIAGERRPGKGEALGVIETKHVAAVIQAADAGLKGARVVLREIRMADGLGGKAFCLFQGAVSEVEAAVEIGVGALPEPQLLVGQVVIPQLHAEIEHNLDLTTYFGPLAGRE
jgi:microcompartment protein CcmL/EutN